MQANFLSIQSLKFNLYPYHFASSYFLKYWKTSTKVYILQKYIECLLPDNNYSNFQHNQNCHIL